MTDISYRLGNEVAKKYLEGKCFFFEQERNISLKTGYAAMDYVLSVTPPSVGTEYTMTFQNPNGTTEHTKFTWNGETGTLHIAEELKAGAYTVRIKLSTADYVQYVEIVVTVQ